MAKIPLTSGFSVIPEGHYVFKITAVEYKEAFGKLNITLETKDKQKHVERYSLLKADGSLNDGAIGAFSYFAKTALNDFEADEVDPNELIGLFIEADIEHDVQENKNKPGKTVTFTRLSNMEASDGWGETDTTSKNSSSKTTSKPAFDLNALLG